MNPPQKPPLRIVKDMNPQQSSGIDYKALVTTVVVTTMASVLTTMGVYWLRDKAARKREVEPMPNQSFNPQMLGPQANQFALPPGGAYYFPPMGGQGMQMGGMPVSPNMQNMQQMGFPQALQFQQPQQFQQQQFQQPQFQQPQPRQRQAANDQVPSYFTNWAKQQDERFTRLEEQLSEQQEDVG